MNGLINSFITVINEIGRGFCHCPHRQALAIGRGTTLPPVLLLPNSNLILNIMNLLYYLQLHNSQNRLKHL